MGRMRHLLLKRSSIKMLVFALILSMSIIALSRPTPIAVKADSQPAPFHSFESPQIHPMAITPDGTKLLVANSPANLLSVFQITDDTPRLLAEIPVGLEPVSVAARNNNEVWVVNWLSDSVSIVDLTTNNVTRTISVGDEPTDVVFAGQNEQAFVCVAGLRQVKAFNPDNLNASPKVVEIEGKQPRSLSRDPEGKRVFVSVFESGNQTTIVVASDVAKEGGLPPPVPAMSPTLPTAPLAGIIVKQQGKNFVDENGDAKWTKYIPYTLADNDLFVIDTGSANFKLKQPVRTIGTHIGNSVFDPASNSLFVVNTESHNLVRFEPKVKGRFISTRVSQISFAAKKAKIKTIDLNTHIDYNKEEGSEQERALTLAMPADIARGNDGKFYVAATGSARVGILNSDGTVLDRINVGEGPTGLAIDQNKQRLFVLNRFDETMSVIDLGSRKELTRLPIGINPEPASVREGRKFLYDGNRTSSHGDVSCASCHRNGHTDGLAWDLGDPTGSVDVVKSKNFAGAGSFTFNFHPMKGPMVTQSLRGIVGTEPLHWRGDRAKITDFNGAFVSLLGRSQKLTETEIEAFGTFVKTMTYPPNPNQLLDRSYANPTSGPSAERGRSIYFNKSTDRGVFTCNFCHSVDSNFGPGTNQLIIPGQLLLMVNGVGEPQSIKVPQLRGIYQKFGFENKPGKQLSGFGFEHDGAIDNLITFLRTPNFNFAGDDERRDVEAFVFSLDTGTAPSVGVQTTIDSVNNPDAKSRISLLMSQSDAKNCELIVKGSYLGRLRGFYYIGNGMFQSDRAGDRPIALADLIQNVGKGAELTFTGVPVGDGKRLGIDRDLDGKFDGD